MSFFKQFFALFLLCLLLGGCVKKSEPVTLTLVFSGNLLGELEPCGCTLEGDFGGIKRQASAIEQLRKQDPNILLVSTGALLDTDAVTAKIKSEYILKGFQQLHYDAVALQSRDTAFGLSLLRTIPLPWLAAGAIDHLAVDEYHKKTKDVPISFFAFMQFTDSVHMTHASQQLSPALIEKIKQRHQQGVLTVLITDQQLEQLQQHLDLTQLDIVIIPGSTAEYSKPQVVGHTIILRPGNQGQKLGVLHLKVSQGRIVTYAQSVQPLGKNTPDSPSLKKWYDQYNQAAKNFYQARAKLSEQVMQKPAYVGAETCGTCHTKEMKIWQASQHSHAISALKQVNKQFDPECVGCHVVGYNKAGGFVDEFLTPQLANVQCESCHGSGTEHVKAPGLNKMPDLSQRHPPVCVACHNEKHSPVFNFEKYWPRIAH